MKKLSIIVPIYNVEKYVHCCLESIFRQGLDDDVFEVILINDGTPDRSMEVIADIIDAHQNIQIINQENKGISQARNKAMDVATGEYIQFVDSDDLLIDNSVSYLLDLALSSKADLVVADFIKKNDNEITSLLQEPIPQKDGSIKEKTGKELLMQKPQSGFSCIWKTLFKRDFLNQNNIRFIPHIYYEDTPFTYQYYAKAQLCLKVNWLLYVYRVGHASITGTFNKKKGMDYCVCIAQIWNYSKEDSFSVQLKQKIQDDIFAYFSMLFYMLSSYGKLKHSEKMEVISNLKKLAPDLSFKHGIKQRFVSFFYQKAPSFYMMSRSFYADYFQNKIWIITKALKN